MGASLDMNSNRIINLPEPVNGSEPLRLLDAATLNGGGTIPLQQLPSGGSTNQVLAKTSATDFAVGWATVRKVITGNITYYVRTDGSNSNTGLTDSSGGAFLTWQFAVNIAKTLDFNGYNVTIQHGTETGLKTFTENAIVPTLEGNGGSLIINGAGATKTLFAPTTGDPWQLIDTLTPVQFGNFKISSTTGSGCFNVQQRSTYVQGNGINFGSSNFAHIYFHDQKALGFILNSTYTISGSAIYHLALVEGGQVFYESNTVTITGTPSFSVFALSQLGGIIRATESSPGSTYTGSATGQRYYVSDNAIISTSAFSETWFPGDAAGQAVSGGSYAGQTLLSGIVLANGAVTPSAITTSAGLANVISDETGTGALVFANTPTLVTPVLGAATGTSLSTTGTHTALNATAIPTGGGAAFLLSSTASFGVFFGAGAPTISAAKGSLYLRSDGSGTGDRMYVNTNGSTTWTAVTTAA